jgi:hypothetical protein
MKRVLGFSLGCAAFLAAHIMGSGVASGQTEDVFTLYIEGPSQLSGSADQDRSATCYTKVRQDGTGPGAQGWSYGIAVTGGLLSNVTVAGTESAFMPEGKRDPDNSFNKTVIIDPAKNGGVNGLVSAIALTTGGLEEAILDSGSDVRILQFQLDTKIPAGGGSASLAFQEGLIGSGQPVDLVVTQDGISASLETEGLDVNLIEVQSCCDDAVNVGFSETLVRGQPAFSGIAGVGELCTADEGQIFQDTPVGGDPAAKRIYPSIISNLAEGNVQGWSYGLLLTGTGAVVAQSAAGTATALQPEGYRDPDNAFNKTQIIDPAKNGGNKGLVSAVALTTGGLETSILPAMGTESVLSVDIDAGEMQAAEAQVNTVAFQADLIGAGQPVALVVTVDGESAEVCNFLLAKVDVVFRVTQVASFRRGNANNDTKVDIADGIWIINELVRGGPATVCQDAADANDDGVVDTSDAVYLINYQFQPGTPPTPFPAPPAPFPDCGADPTEDSLACGGSQSSCS